MLNFGGTEVGRVEAGEKQTMRNIDRGYMQIIYACVVVSFHLQCVRFAATLNISILELLER